MRITWELPGTFCAKVKVNDQLHYETVATIAAADICQVVRRAGKKHDAVLPIPMESEEDLHEILTNLIEAGRACRFDSIKATRGGESVAIDFTPDAPGG